MKNWNEIMNRLEAQVERQVAAAKEGHKMAKQLRMLVEAQRNKRRIQIAPGLLQTEWNLN